MKNQRNQKVAKLGDLLSRAVRKAGIAGQIDAAMVVEAGNQALIEQFGEGVLEHAACRAVKREVLSVMCTHSALASEIKVHQTSIIEALTRRAPYSGVEDIFVMHGTRTDRGASWDTEL